MSGQENPLTAPPSLLPIALLPSSSSTLLSLSSPSPSSSSYPSPSNMPLSLPSKDKLSSNNPPSAPSPVTTPSSAPPLSLSFPVPSISSFSKTHFSLSFLALSPSPASSPPLFCGSALHQVHLNRHAPSPESVSTPTKLIIKNGILRFPSSASLSISLPLLIDSGADNNFLDSSFAIDHDIPTVLLPTTVTLYLADGSSHLITHQTQPAALFIGDHYTTVSFLLTKLTHTAILGYPWLAACNPMINWTTQSLSFNISNLTIPKLSEQVYPNLSETMLPSTSTSIPAPFVDQFSLVFSKELALTLPPHRTNFDFKVNLVPDSLPPSNKTYNLTGQEKIAMKEWLDTHLAQGFIRPSHSPYAAPCFFINKKDGDLRLCIDYRKLNGITIRTRYPLPRINEIINKVATGKLFTALDLRGAYNRIRVCAGDESKLAFITNFGLFEFLVMPFGPTDAPGYFQAFMNSLFNHLPFVAIYLDDIIIFSSDKTEHTQHVKVVLSILLKHQLYCKLEKCQFYMEKLSYLGFVISSTGIRMDPQKLSTIASWPAPTSRKELESFLGFTNFYRRFISHYADLTYTLTLLLSKSVSFNWLKEHQEAFTGFKDKFIDTIQLFHVKDGFPFEVECDCSDFALGAILSQRLADDSLIPLAFYARKLSSSERNYPIYDKELLSIHNAFQEWRHFLQGSQQEVVVWSDHKSLSYFMTTKQLTRRHARWSLFFSSFHFVIKPRAGIDNAQADALSRRPDFKPTSQELENTFSLLAPEQFVPRTELHNIISTLTIPNDVLHARLGHPGSLMLRRTMKSFPSIKVVGRSDHLCDPCARGKSKRRPFGRVSKRKYDVLEVLSADIQYFSTPSNDGTKANIKIIDHATKYLKTFLLKDRTALTLLEDLRPFIARMERQSGHLVKFIRTDLGGEFDAEVLDFLSKKGIVRQKTTPYYHIDPGRAEHAHQTVLYMARSLLIASNLPIQFYGDAILTATYIHNRLVHSGETKTPYELLKGRPPRIDHLRPFGCISYVHVPAETRSKLAPAAVRCRLVGYGDDDEVEEIRGYKFVMEDDLKYIIYSSDVRFDEGTPPTPLSGFAPFDFSHDNNNIFGDPSYSDSDSESETWSADGK